MGGPENGNFPLLFVVKMSLRNIKMVPFITIKKLGRLIFTFNSKEITFNVIFSFFCFAGALLGPPIAGAIYSATGAYATPFFVAGGFFILASLIGVCAQVLQMRRKSAIKITRQMSANGK